MNQWRCRAVAVVTTATVFSALEPAMSGVRPDGLARCRHDPLHGLPWKSTRALAAHRHSPDTDFDESVSTPMNWEAAGSPETWQDLVFPNPTSKLAVRSTSQKRPLSSPSPLTSIQQLSGTVSAIFPAVINGRF